MDKCSVFQGNVGLDYYLILFGSLFRIILVKYTLLFLLLNTPGKMSVKTDEIV